MYVWWGEWGISKNAIYCCMRIEQKLYHLAVQNGFNIRHILDIYWWLFPMFDQVGINICFFPRETPHTVFHLCFGGNFGLFWQIFKHFLNTFVKKTRVSRENVNNEMNLRTIFNQVGMLFVMKLDQNTVHLLTCIYDPGNHRL